MDKYMNKVMLFKAARIDDYKKMNKNETKM